MGTANITVKVTTVDKDFTATCNVTVIAVTVPVTGVTLDKATSTLDVGETDTLVATIEPTSATNQNVTWSSDDDTVATVVNGVITAKAVGSATITVTTVDGDFTDTCEVTVVDTTPPVITASYNSKDYTADTTITILPSEASSLEVSATATDNTDGTVVVSIAYSSEDVGATVSNLETAKTHLGTMGNKVKITFTAMDTVGNSGELILTFESGSIEISENDVTNIASTYDYTGEEIEPEPVVTVNGVTLINGTDYTVSYANNTDLSTTDKKATVTITGMGNYSGSVAVEFQIVAVNVTGIKLDSNYIYLNMEDQYTKTLTATITPDNATNKAVTWVSSDEDFATVDENGVVTPVAVGTATITVTTEDGSFTDTCEVTVTAEAVTLYQVTVTNGTGSGVYQVGDTVTITADSGGSGLAFGKWVADSADVVFGDSTASTTTFTMPATDVTVTAYYQQIVSLTNNDTVKITVSPDSYIETGKAIVPDSVTVRLEGVMWQIDLVEGKDYTLSYSNNIAVGTATVTVAGIGAYSGYATASFTITEAPASADPTVSSVTVNPSTATIAKGGNKTFTATVNGDNSPVQTVTWSVTGGRSSETTISDNGVLTIGENETATNLIVSATSTYDEGKTGYATVTVSDGTAPEVGEGENITIELDVNGGTLGESSLTSCVITKGGTITQALPTPTRENYYFNGWYTAASGGSQVTASTTFDADSSIYAQWKSKPTTATITITVSLDTEMVSSLSSTLVLTIQNIVGDLYLFADENGLLSGEVLPEIKIDGYTFLGWYMEEVSETTYSLFSVSSNYVKIEDSTIFTTDTVIYPYLVEEGTEEDDEEETGTDVTGVIISLSSLSITAGNTHTLSATVSPTTAEVKTVKWSSSNTSVATVNYLGVVTGVSAGSAVITVTTVDGGYTASCTVTVVSAGFTITLDTNGGTLSTTALYTNSNGYVSSYPSPVRSNYTFNGWFTTRTGGTQVTTGTQYSYNQTIYAQWVYNSGGSTSGSTSAVGSYTNSTSYTQNGTVTISPQTADVGSTVYVSVSPSTGYEIGEVLAMRISTGAVLELSSYGNGNYSFEQPGGSVRVTATFNKIPTESAYSGMLDVPVVGTMLPSTFDDVASTSWYYSAVKFTYDRGLMSGTGSGNFSPDMNTSRGMIVQVLYNMAGKPTPYGRTFADVGEYAYYASAVSWAAGLGIVGGIGENLFAPNSDMTREQLVVMLYAFERTLGGAAYLGDKYLYFSDSYAISSWAVEATAWCVSKGIVAGKPDGTFDPQAPATRAEVAQILKNFVELYI